MALGFEKHVIECSDLKKCGEITARLTVGNKEYFLNCEFCDYSFLQIENFMQHIFEDHFAEFSQLDNVHKAKEESSHGGEETEDFETSLGIQNNLGDTIDTDSEYRDFERVEIELDHTEQENSVDIKEESIESEFISEDSSHQGFGEAEDAELREILFKSYCESEAEVYEVEQSFEAKQNTSAECSKIVETIHNYDKKQTFIIELIELYRSLRALWDPKCPDYTDRMIRNLQYETLLEKYKEQHPEANKDDVRQKIYALRTTFRRESKRLLPFEKSTLYYYDAMSFLIENEKRDDVRISALDTVQDNITPTGKRTPPPESLLNDEQFIMLAKIYQGYPNLWDDNDISYRFSNRRRESLRSVCHEFNEESGLNLEQNELEKEIARLRKACSTEKKQKINCRLNNLVYEPTCPFYEHITFLEINVHPYECTVCGEVISGAYQFKLHLASHDGTLPYICKICGHGFKLSSNLTVHLRRHVQDYTYRCEVCNKACATTSELKIHLRYHTGEKNYVCDICGQKYYTASKFNTHMRRHENRPRHRCEICGKGFLTRGLYQEHVSAHGDVRDKLCDVCNKGFKNRIQLKQHKRIHDPIKKYVCKICGKRFAQRAGLAGHMKSHGTKLTAKKTATELENITDLFFRDNLGKREQVCYSEKFLPNNLQF